MVYVNTNVLDNGLAQLKSQASAMHICSQEPTTYTEATSTYTLGNKNFGAGSVYPAAIAAGSPSGRQLASAAVTDGTVTGTGTATHYAVVSATQSRLDVAQSLSASQAVTSGNTFTLAAATIRLPGTGG